MVLRRIEAVDDTPLAGGTSWGRRSRCHDEMMLDSRSDGRSIIFQKLQRISRLELSVISLATCTLAFQHKEQAKKLTSSPKPATNC